MKYLKNKKGSALVLAIILLMVVTMMGAAMLFSVTAEVRLNRADEDRMTAAYLAQAGINHGLYIIENTGEDFHYPYEKEIILGDRSRMYHMLITKSGTELSIQSTGKIELDSSVKKQVTLKAVISEDGQVIVEQSK